MRPRLAHIFLGVCLPLAMGFFFFPLVSAARGQQAGKALTRPAPVQEVKIQEKGESGKHLVSLDPFFLIEDKASRTRVRRVDLALVFTRPEAARQFDPQATPLREALYDFLVTHEHDPGMENNAQGKVLAGIVNRVLGQDAVADVKVDQSILLLR